MRRKLTSALLSLALLAGAALAGDRGSAGAEDVVEHPSCDSCGMSRESWSHTRHLIEYQDGHVEATCSLRCAALSLDTNLGSTPIRILAADAGSDDENEPLWPVEQLTYVLDPTESGTMAPRSKWAYRSRAEARRARGKEGELMDFDRALMAAFEDVVAEVARARKRQRERRRRRQR